MQERIIEIIVYLLTALQQDRQHKYKVDLTCELTLKGYTEVEINLAFSWIFKHFDKSYTDQLEKHSEGFQEFDDIPDVEELIITPDAYAYLLQLFHLGVVKEHDMEMFIERALAYGKNDINIEDLKSIVATIIFGLDNRSSFNGYSFKQGDQTIQ